MSVPKPSWDLVDGDLRSFLPTLQDGSIDVIITDPPYSAHVHKSVRSARRNEAPDVAEFECRTRRAVDLGFDHLTPDLRRFCALQFARLACRWVAVFSDLESCHLWRRSLEAAGLRYVRTAVWVRLGGAPQFTGTEPAMGVEAITLAHPYGRRRWNGGGKAGVYTYPIVANRLGQRGSRVHPTQKPLELMVDLVNDFSDPGERVLDPFAGSGTTGVACVARGRRFLGVELKAEHFETASARLAATEPGQPVFERSPKQTSMFGGGSR